METDPLRKFASAIPTTVNKDAANFMILLARIDLIFIIMYDLYIFI